MSSDQPPSDILNVFSFGHRTQDADADLLPSMNQIDELEKARAVRDQAQRTRQE